MCKVKGCGRPQFARGLCGLHALQGYYRTEVFPETGLAAVRVTRRLRILPLTQRREDPDARIAIPRASRGRALGSPTPRR